MSNYDIFFLSPFRKFIWKEFDRRKRDFGLTYPDTSKLLTDLKGPRSTWIRATSNAIVEEGTSGNVISGLTLELGKSFEDSYGFSDDGTVVGVSKGKLIYAPQDNRYRPGPGIDSFTLGYSGGFGTIKRGTLKWQCSTISQFNILENFFLVPGVTILVEFGWSNVGPDILFSLKDEKELVNAWQEIYEIDNRVVSSNGQYDAMLGMVTNFSWELDSEGMYRCTTDITTVGDTYIHLRGDYKHRKTPASETEGPLTLRKFFDSKIESLRLEGTPNDDVFMQNSRLPKTTVKYPEDEEIAKVDYEREFHENDDWMFISWGYFESIINDFYKMELKSQGGGKVDLFLLDSSDVRISADSKLISTNGDVLIIPNPNAPQYNDLGKDSGPKSLKIGTHSFPPAAGVGGTPDSGLLYDLFINVKAIQRALDRDPYIGFMQQLLGEISAAGCYMWNFQVRSRGDKENVLHVVDLNYIDPDVKTSVSIGPSDDASKAPADDNPVPYLFRVMDADSIVRDFSVESDLPSQMISTIVNSRVSEVRDKIIGGRQDVVGNLYKAVDDVILHKLDNDGIEPPYQKPDNVKKLDIEPREYWRLINPSTGKILRYAYPDKEVVNSNLYKNETSRTSNRNNNYLVPINANVTVDGISGIRVGDVFMIDHLPERYKKIGVFQTIDIQHDISMNGWTTRLEGQLRIVNNG